MIIMYKGQFILRGEAISQIKQIDGQAVRLPIIYIARHKTFVL